MPQAPPSPEVQKAIQRTIDWVKLRFRRHYESRELLVPDRFPRREFGFMFWGPGMMMRHQGFSTAKELRDFLVQRVPMHVYHSSAYYEDPAAPTMEEKGWLGADLIFAFVVQLVIRGTHEMSEQNYLPFSQIIHERTESWGPDSPFGHLLTYLLVILPGGWLLLRAVFSKRPVFTTPAPPALPDPPTQRHSHSAAR